MLQRKKRVSSLLLLILKIVFLIFIGVYVLTLPAYYFLVLHTVSDVLMPFEVGLCFALSFVSFVWVFKMTGKLHKEMMLNSKIGKVNYAYRNQAIENALIKLREIES